MSFAAWGLISAFAPAFRSDFQLTAQQTAFLVAVPVLLGSLADRFGRFAVHRPPSAVRSPPSAVRGPILNSDAWVGFGRLWD